VGRLGVAASYGVPAAAVERAFEQGVNYFYWGTFRHGGFGEAIRHLAPQRDRFILVIQSYARIAGLMGWSVERALRALRLDHADVLLLGLWNKPVPARIMDAARRLKERGPGALRGLFLAQPAVDCADGRGQRLRRHSFSLQRRAHRRRVGHLPAHSKRESARHGELHHHQLGATHESQEDPQE
jgi:hypothetical protein